MDFTGVAEVFQRCYRDPRVLCGLTGLLPGCYRGVTVVLHGCDRVVTGVIKGCLGEFQVFFYRDWDVYYSDISRVL